MGIFSRFADIVNSNLNAMLDKAEDPEKMIALIIQEMEETLVEGRSNLARLLADKKDIRRRHDQRELEAAEWEKKAKLALSKERDDLAKAALMERDVLLKEKQSLATQLENAEGQLGSLTSEIEQLQSKLDDAKAKQKALVMRSCASNEIYKVKQQSTSRRFDDSYTKLAAFERKLDMVEGKIESLDIGRRDLASEIDELANSEALEAELARLKGEIRSS